jgi:Protein of unknown function (DUF3500)
MREPNFLVASAVRRPSASPINLTPRIHRLALPADFLLIGLLPSRAHDATEEMVAAATNFLAALTPGRRAKAVYEMKSDERLNWDYAPRARAGLPLKGINFAQRKLAHGDSERRRAARQMIRDAGWPDTPSVFALGATVSARD